jgi:hypothetical protein
LDAHDSSGTFDALLSRHSNGTNKIVAKGAILLRIIKFVIAIEGDSPDVQGRLTALGKSHSKRGIRPWSDTKLMHFICICERICFDALPNFLQYL